MKSLSHARAQVLIHLSRGELNPEQMDVLNRHLAGCQSCQEYASFQEQVAPAVERMMHTRWDPVRESFQPARMLEKRRSKSMQIKHAVSFAAAGLLLVAAVLGLPALLRQALPSALTQQTVSFSTPARTDLPFVLAASPTPVLHTLVPGDTLVSIALRYGVKVEDILAANPGLDENNLVVGEHVVIPGVQSDLTEEISDLSLQLDPSACIAPVITPAPPGLALPYPAQGVIGGGEVQNRDFTFNIWLYCDELLSPDDMEHYSDLAGLGIFARWRYSGPKIEGEFWDMFGVAPDVRMVTGSPMQNGSGASMGMGLQLPNEPAGQWEIAELARSGAAIPLVVKVQSVDGVYGAELGFKLKAGESGYIPYDIEMNALPVENLANQPEIEIPEEQSLPSVEAPIARYPAANGAIAFSTGGSDQVEIFAMQPDGSELMNLTSHPAIDTNPVWSPDGRQIAFLSDRRGEGVMDVYVMNADGSQPRLVYALPAQFPSPEVGEAGETPAIFWLSWSPDGQYILAEARLADVTMGSMAEKCLVIAKVDGEGRMCVSNLDFTAPQWSPDGKYISYSKHLNGMERTLVTLDVAALFSEDIRQERPIYSQDGWQISSQAQWSPDGQYVAVNVVNDITRKGSLWVGAASGAGGEMIADLGSPYDIWFSGGLGSADSTRVMAIDGADVIPAWSPDGAWIAFSGQGKLHVVRPDGSQQTDLLEVEVLSTVSWSPDGRYLLFNAGEESQAYLLDFAAALTDPGQVQAAPLAVDPDLYAWFYAWQPVLP